MPVETQVLPPTTTRALFIVVADNGDDVALVARALNAVQPSCSIQSFPNAEAAKSFLEQAIAQGSSVPTAIFADLHLPGVGVVELVQWIEGQRTLAATKLFVISAHVPKPVSVEHPGTRKIWFLPKPAAGFDVALGMLDAWAGRSVLSRNPIDPRPSHDF